MPNSRTCGPQGLSPNAAKSGPTPPGVTDLRWVYLGDRTVHFEWTNPRDKPARFEKTAQCLNLSPDQYDVRFMPHGLIKTERDWGNASRIDFRWEGHQQASRSLPSVLLDSSDDSRCQFLIHFSEHSDLVQFRERTPGSYAVKYRAGHLGWSLVSNDLYDEAHAVHQRVHEFDIRVVGSGGVSAYIVAGGVVDLEIRDIFSHIEMPYLAVVVGLSVGASVGATRPLQNEWAQFKPTRHLHLWDFDGKGFRIVSQGIAVKYGVGRCSITIHESEGDAHANQRVIAGPIDFGGWGLTEGLEATGLQIMVGYLKALGLGSGVKPPVGAPLY